MLTDRKNKFILKYQHLTVVHFKSKIFHFLLIEEKEPNMKLKELLKVKYLLNYIFLKNSGKDQKRGDEQESEVMEFYLEISPLQRAGHSLL